MFSSPNTGVILPPFRYTEAILCRIPEILPPQCSISTLKNGTRTPTSDKQSQNGLDSIKGKKKNKLLNFGSSNSIDKVQNQNHNSSNSSDTLTKQNGESIQNIDSKKCREEYELLASVLRDIGLDVVELPPDNSCPMSFFVGDVAFVLNGMGIVTRPKSPTRQAELATIRTMLKNELDIPLIVVDDKEAYIEGADILFTGRELFVGISDYTNVAGARFLAKTFPEYPCTPIKVPGPCHLTHYVNMASPDLICVGSGEDSQGVIKRMERDATFQYQTITMPEDQASDILFVNGTLIHLSAKEIPMSFKLFSEKLTLPRRTVDLSELSKLSANLSRLVILLNKSKKKSIRP